MASFRFFAVQIEANGNTWRYWLSEAHATEAERDWRRRGAKVTVSPYPVEHDAGQTNAPRLPGTVARGARTGDRLNCQGETATAVRSKHAKRRPSTKAKG